MADPLIREMQQLVGSWLEQGDWQQQQLIDWLQGFGLPSARYEDEPFQWLLRGVPLAAERYRAEREFARRAAALLDDQPDVHPVGRRPNEVLYNLLELCAGLSVADYLADPLYAMFDRQALAGEWRGIDLRSTLRRALISSQKDNRLEPVWQDMLSGKGHAWLPGDYYDGFEGIRLQPKSADTRGKPDLDAIGRALAAMTKHIESSTDCRIEFRRLVDRVIATYSGRPSWDADLIEQADKNMWPIWAVSALPSLYVRLSPEHAGSAGNVRYLIWNFLIPTLVELGKHFSIERKLCDEDIICEVILYEEAESNLYKIIDRIEQRRVDNPYKSYKAVVQGCRDLLINKGMVLMEEITGGEEVKELLDQFINHDFSDKVQELYRQSIDQDNPQLLSAALGA